MAARLLPVQSAIRDAIVNAEAFSDIAGAGVVVGMATDNSASAVVVCIFPDERCNVSRCCERCEAPPICRIVFACLYCVCIISRVFLYLFSATVPGGEIKLQI